MIAHVKLFTLKGDLRKRFANYKRVQILTQAKGCINTYHRYAQNGIPSYQDLDYERGAPHYLATVSYAGVICDVADSFDPIDIYSLQSHGGKSFSLRAVDQLLRIAKAEGALS